MPSDSGPTYMYDFAMTPDGERAISTTFGSPARCAAGIDPTCLGDEVAVWDVHTEQVIQTESLGANSGALMVRFIGQEGVRRAFINTPGTSAVWLADDDDGDGVFDFQQVLGPDEGIELPMDMVVSYDNTTLYVSNWFANTVQQFDISDPFHPTLQSTVSVPHPNMLRLSRDNNRLYVTNSLLTPWDNDADFGEPRNSDYGIWLFEVGSAREPHTAPRRRQRLGQLHQRRQADDHRPRRPPHDALRPQRSARSKASTDERSQPHELGVQIAETDSVVGARRRVHLPMVSGPERAPGAGRGRKRSSECLRAPECRAPPCGALQHSDGCRAPAGPPGGRLSRRNTPRRRRSADTSPTRRRASTVVAGPRRGCAGGRRSGSGFAEAGVAGADDRFGAVGEVKLGERVGNMVGDGHRAHA